MQARGVLEISNKLRYENNKMITVIDGRDIADKKLRNKLNLPQKVRDDLFSLVFDISKTFPGCNIAVDEVLFEDLKKVDKIHSDEFKGRIWVGLGSQAFYDFQSGEDKPTSDLQKIPIINNQGFRVVQLSKN